MNRLSNANTWAQVVARNLSLAALVVSVLIGLPRPCHAETALDAYIAKPDASYGFSLIDTISGSGFTGYYIDMTSQTWRSSTEITNGTRWLHPMTITKPDVMLSNTAILLIGGGSRTSGYELQSDIALATGAVTINLPTVPNQPLQFAGEPFTRTEDEIIAKTFANFLDGGDSEWPLLLPMVKSAVRAMDTAQTHMANQGVTIDNFFVIGASKRGWTTWLTAAVDDRVAAIAPAVIDVLNIDASMAHHRMAYEGMTERIIGGYSEEVHDYVDENVMSRLGTPRGQELLTIVDPYEYRDRFDMPKYIVNSTGDEFFVPDSSQFYFDDLIGPKYLRYVPNTGHGLNEDAVNGALAFYYAVSQGIPLPEFSWEISDDGTMISVDAVDTPVSALLWQASNPESRDYRINTFGPNWTSSVLSEEAPGEYVAQIAMPPTGSTAFMVEMTYFVGGVPISFTTNVSVVQIPEPAAGVLLFATGFLAMLGPLRRHEEKA